MNARQRNHYERTIVNLMNRFAKYINYLVDFGKKYENTVKNLCEKSNCNIEDVIISQELIDFEKQIKASYNKAKSFYKDLEYIRNQNKSLMNIQPLINSFNTRVNFTKFIAPKNITLQFINNTIIKEACISNTDYSNELEQLEKDTVELGIYIDKIKSEINYFFLDTKKINKEKLIKKINELKKDADENSINKLYEVLEVQNDITDKILNLANVKLEELKNKLEKEILDILSDIDNDSMTEIEYILENLQNKYDEFKQYLNEYKGLNLFLASMKALTDGLVFAGRKYEDAAGLWVLESSNFTRGLGYLRKNGRLIEHISDLDNSELEKIVRKKCATQKFNTDDPKGIIFHKNSPLAKSITSSIEFKNLIKDNFSKLVLLDEKIALTYTEFNWKSILNGENYNLSINNHLSIHKTDLLGLYIENGVIYATMLDTEDYNNPKEFAPYLLQQAGIIKNYYFIVDIEIPLKDILPKID